MKNDTVKLENGERKLFSILKKLQKAFRRERIVYTVEPTYFEVYFDLGHPDDEQQFQLYVMIEDDELRVTDWDEVKDFFICSADEIENLIAWLKGHKSLKTGKLVCE